MQNELYLPTDYGSSSDYNVNGLNQITDETSGGSILNISYDKNGNLTNDGVTTFGYDLFNRLTSASGGTSFDYDATGRLYSITSSSANTYFLYDGQALIGEYTVDGSGSVSLQRRYIHGLDVDTPIVWYEGSTVSNATRRYLVRDELGSVVLVTDNNGDAVHHNAYDEYGVPDASNIGRFQYTGQTWLDEAGLYYYKARVYNPYLGRFHQTDPIGYGDGMNMYAYVGNDPVNAIDPNGTCEVAGGKLTECTLEFDPDLSEDQLKTAEDWVAALAEIGEAIQNSDDAEVKKAFEDIKGIKFFAEDMTNADGSKDPLAAASALEGDNRNEIHFWNGAYLDRSAVENKTQYSGHEIEHFTERDLEERIKRLPQGSMGARRAEQKADARSITWMQQMGLLRTPYQSQTGYTYGRWYPNPPN